MDEFETQKKVSEENSIDGRRGHEVSKYDFITVNFDWFLPNELCKQGKETKAINNSFLNLIVI